MKLPDEFFEPAELAAILETPQQARQCEILKDQGVPFVKSASGKPRVYRDRLLPSSEIKQNADFDFSELAGARRAAKEAH